MKTKEEQIKMTVNYLEQTAKHVFMTEDGNFLRVDKDEEGKWYIFRNEIISISNIKMDNIFGDIKQNTKNILFPKGHGYKAVKKKLIKKLTE